jgi:hydroxyethylthiazole kinase
MNITVDDLSSNLKLLKKRNPLVHNITNVVVTNVTANALLAIGASPIMAYAKEEMEDIISISDALVLNIGTLTKDIIDVMLLAGKYANIKNIPVVFDPVGAGASSLRNDASKEIISNIKLAIIRGNESEIANIYGIKIETKGVESRAHIEDKTGLAKELALRVSSAVCISGKEDIISDGSVVFSVKNGDAVLTKMTGSGCISSSVMGAFAAIDKNSVKASLTGAVAIGICGELAAAKSKMSGSFQVEFFNNLSIFSSDILDKYAKFEEIC